VECGEAGSVRRIYLGGRAEQLLTTGCISSVRARARARARAELGFGWGGRRLRGWSGEYPLEQGRVVELRVRGRGRGRVTLSTAGWFSLGLGLGGRGRVRVTLSTAGWLSFEARTTKGVPAQG